MRRGATSGGFEPPGATVCAVPNSCTLEDYCDGAGTCVPGERVCSATFQTLKGTPGVAVACQSKTAATCTISFRIGDSVAQRAAASGAGIVAARLGCPTAPRPGAPAGRSLPRDGRAAQAVRWRPQGEDRPRVRGQEEAQALEDGAATTPLHRPRAHGHRDDPPGRRDAADPAGAAAALGEEASRQAIGGPQALFRNRRKYGEPLSSGGVS